MGTKKVIKNTAKKANKEIVVYFREDALLFPTIDTDESDAIQFNESEILAFGLDIEEMFAMDEKNDVFAKVTLTVENIEYGVRECTRETNFIKVKKGK